MFSIQAQPQNYLLDPGFDSQTSQHPQYPWSYTQWGYACSDIDGAFFLSSHKSVHIYTGSSPNVDYNSTVSQIVNNINGCYAIEAGAWLWTNQNYNWAQGSEVTIKLDYGTQTTWLNQNLSVYNSNYNVSNSNPTEYSVFDTIPNDATRIRFSIILSKPPSSTFQSTANADNTYLYLNSLTPLPLSVLISSPTTTICYGETVTFTSNITNGGNNPTYTWYKNNTVVGNSISYNTSSLNNSDTIYCVVTSNGNCISGSPAKSNEVIVQVKNVPVAPSLITGNDTICQGDIGNYSIQQINQADFYSWTLPVNASIISGDSTEFVTIDFANAVSGILSVVGVNNCGSGSSSTMNITVKHPPSAPSQVSGPINVCDGDSGILYSAGPVLNASFYNWFLPSGASGTSDTNSISVDFTGSLSGNLNVQAGNECGLSNMTGLFVNINPVPATPQITIDTINNTITSDSPIGNQWYNQNGVIQGQNNQSYQVTENGVYYCIVTLQGCASDTSNSINVTSVISSIFNEPSNIKFYPNPAQTYINILSDTHENYHLKIFDIFGSLLIEEINVFPESEKRVDVSGLKGGMYNIIIYNRGRVFHNKIIIQ